VPRLSALQHKLSRKSGSFSTWCYGQPRRSDDRGRGHAYRRAPNGSRRVRRSRMPAPFNRTLTILLQSMVVRDADMFTTKIPPHRHPSATRVHTQQPDREARAAPTAQIRRAGGIPPPPLHRPGRRTQTLPTPRRTLLPLPRPVCLRLSCHAPVSYGRPLRMPMTRRPRLPGGGVSCFAPDAWGPLLRRWCDCCGAPKTLSSRDRPAR
jgi:hypothetical protein